MTPRTVLRPERFPLRLTSDELALVKEMATIGRVSLNTAICQLISLGAPEYRRRHLPAPEPVQPAPRPRPAGPDLFREPPSAPADES